MVDITKAIDCVIDLVEKDQIKTSTAKQAVISTMDYSAGIYQTLTQFCYDLNGDFRVILNALDNIKRRYYEKEALINEYDRTINNLHHQLHQRENNLMKYEGDCIDLTREIKRLQETCFDLQQENTCLKQKLKENEMNVLCINRNNKHCSSTYEDFSTGLKETYNTSELNFDYDREMASKIRHSNHYLYSTGNENCKKNLSRCNNMSQKIMTYEMKSNSMIDIPPINYTIRENYPKYDNMLNINQDNYKKTFEDNQSFFINQRNIMAKEEETHKRNDIISQQDNEKVIENTTDITKNNKANSHNNHNNNSNTHIKEPYVFANDSDNDNEGTKFTNEIKQIIQNQKSNKIKMANELQNNMSNEHHENIPSDLISVIINEDQSPKGSKNEPKNQNIIINSQINSLPNNNNNSSMHMNTNAHSNHSNNQLNPSNNESEKYNRVHSIITKAFKDDFTINAIKSKLGNDFEERIIKGEVDEDYLYQVEQVLNQIKPDNNIKKQKSHSIEKKSNSNNNTIVSQNRPRNKSKAQSNDPNWKKLQLKKAITNNKYQYKEYPRGWNSSKDYFVNNNSACNEKMGRSTHKITTFTSL